MCGVYARMLCMYVIFMFVYEVYVMRVLCVCMFCMYVCPYVCCDSMYGVFCLYGFRCGLFYVCMLCCACMYVMVLRMRVMYICE